MSFPQYGQGAPAQGGAAQSYYAAAPGNAYVQSPPMPQQQPSYGQRYNPQPYAPQQPMYVQQPRPAHTGRNCCLGICGGILAWYVFRSSSFHLTDRQLRTRRNLLLA